jgi:hypothetical protein
MRCGYFVLLASATFFCCTQLQATEDTSDLPLRKAGLWEVRTSTDEGRGAHNQQLTMCVGEEMERNSVRASAIENRSGCSKYDVKKNADETTVDAFCIYGERQVTNHTELSGDFKTAFSVKVVSTTAGNAPRAQGGQPVNVHRTIVQNGKYLGESCGELKAGEAKTADGLTVTVQ